MTLSNRITLLRVIAVPFLILAWYALPGQPYLAAALFVLAALSDILDGAVARQRGEITVFGQFMDPIADKILVLTATLLLLGAGRMPMWAGLCFVLREVWVSGVRLVAVSAGEVVAASLLGKLKTVTQMVAIVLLMIGNWPFSYVRFPMDMVWLLASTAFCLWSGVEYTLKNLPAFRARGKSEGHS